MSFCYNVGRLAAAGPFTLGVLTKRRLQRVSGADAVRGRDDESGVPGRVGGPAVYAGNQGGSRCSSKGYFSFSVRPLYSSSTVLMDDDLPVNGK